MSGGSSFASIRRRTRCWPGSRSRTGLPRTQDLRQVVTVDGVVHVIQPTFHNGGSAITAVDAATNRVLGTAVIRVSGDLESSIGGLVARKGEVWADNRYRLVRIDPRTGRLLDEAAQLPEPPPQDCSRPTTEDSGSSATTAAPAHGGGRCRCSTRRPARSRRWSMCRGSPRTRWPSARIRRGSSTTTAR
jgi:hypothetical protein